MSSAARVTFCEWKPSMKLRCQFCGGPQCKRCSRQAALRKLDSPIWGLHADWVTPNILGMMRPSNRLLEEFHIISQFQTKGIGAVFNVTIPGEHANCGDGLYKYSGFPYDPELLMKAQISFYNFGWEDMTVPTPSFMLNVVKLMSYELQVRQTNIAVHCHAGYGRTGLAIACSLMYIHQHTPQEVIDIVRKGRPGSIQTKKQLAFVHQFYGYLNDNKLPVYALQPSNCSSGAEGVSAYSLEQFVRQQQRLLHGNEALQYRHLPKVLAYLCEHIGTAAKESPLQVLQLLILSHAQVAQTLPSSQPHTEAFSSVDRPPASTPTAPAFNLDPPTQQTPSTHYLQSLFQIFSGTEDQPTAQDPCIQQLFHVIATIYCNPEELKQWKQRFNRDEYPALSHAEIRSITVIYQLLLLLFDWLDHLAEPAIASQEWAAVLQSPSVADTPMKGTKAQASRALLALLFNTFHPFQKLQNSPWFPAMCKRLVLSLTHTCMEKAEQRTHLEASQALLQQAFFASAFTRPETSPALGGFDGALLNIHAPSGAKNPKKFHTRHHSDLLPLLD